MPEFLELILEVITVAVDGVGLSILVVTATRFVVRYAVFEVERVRGQECARRFRDIRLELGSRIILAIDFMVISDVIHSSFVHTRESLINLGLFVLIRSALAFFIGLDMKDVREEAE